MGNRRLFLRNAVAAIATAFLYPLTAGPISASRRKRSIATPSGIHPPEIALFFGSDDLPVLRARFADDALFSTLRERLLSTDRSALRAFLRNEVRYNDHLTGLPKVYGPAQDMAFLYAMTGDEEARDLATEAVRTLMNFRTWDYFLEAGTDVIGLQRAPGSAIAVACVLDWLGDSIDASERREWARALGERGLEPSYRSTYGMRYPDRVVGWSFDPESTYLEQRPGDDFDLTNWPVILNGTNLKAIPAAALAVGSVAYRNVIGEDESTQRWLEQAIFTIRSFDKIYAADGSYPEGVSYANYTSIHLAMAIEALERAGAAGLFDHLNWIGYGEYLRETSLPTKDNPASVVNFGDAGLGATSAVSFWTAGKASDPQSQWFGQTLAREHDAFSLIWFDPDVDAEAPGAEPHLWRNDLDWVVARTGYEPDDLVAAMRSGGPANHEHADRNSIIVKCHGEILVADPLHVPYSTADPAWIMRTTAGHSALLIDGRGHQYHDGSEGTNSSDAYARIVRSGDRTGYCFWASDATQAYQLVNADVDSVTRTILVFYDLPAVIVADKVLKATRASTLEARFIAMNEDGGAALDANGSGFRVIRPGATLHGRAASTKGVTVETGRFPISGEHAQHYPFVSVKTGEGALDPMLVTVLLPVQGSAVPEIQIEPEGNEFRIQLTSGDRRTSCVLFDRGSLPELEVSI